MAEASSSKNNSKENKGEAYRLINHELKGEST